MIESSLAYTGPGGYGGGVRSCTPIYRTLPSFFISRSTATLVATSDMALTMTMSILGALNFTSFASIAALTAAGSTFRMAPGRTGPTLTGGTDSDVVQNSLS